MICVLYETARFKVLKKTNSDQLEYELYEGNINITLLISNLGYLTTFRAHFFRNVFQNAGNSVSDAQISLGGPPDHTVIILIILFE